MDDTKKEPRAWTADETAERLVEKMVHMGQYWATNPNCGTMEERVSGAMFSALSNLDGGSLDLPAFDLIPTPHEDDKEWHIERGENYYDPDALISVSLHDRYHPAKRRLYPELAPSGKRPYNPEEQREIFVATVMGIAEQNGDSVADKLDACHRTAEQILHVLDGVHDGGINSMPVPPFMLFAAPSDQFNRAQLASGLKEWDSSIPLNRKRTTYGIEEKIVDDYSAVRQRSINAARQMFGKD